MNVTMSEEEFARLLSQIEKITWPENAEKSDGELVSDTGDHLLRLLGYDNGCLVIFSEDYAQIHHSYYFGNDKSRLQECEADVTELMKRTGYKPLFSNEDTILDWQGGKYYDYTSIPVHPTPEYIGVLGLVNSQAEEKKKENVEILQIRSYVALYCIASLFIDRLIARQQEIRITELQASLARGIVSCSARMKEVMEYAKQIARSDSTVLISGESGVGKELVARYIHAISGRKDCLALNCGAVSKDLVGSILFGHCKGAFTGAIEDNVGLFEAASGGTVLLDEISEMPQDEQMHLLRVLEERKVQRLGEHVSRNVDVRIIAITNRDLYQEVKEERFRQDLFYRINVIPIEIPPLRERKEDIPTLIEFFCREYGEKNGKPDIRFSPEAIRLLQNYHWPGNVRELRNVVERLVVITDGVIHADALPQEVRLGRLASRSSRELYDTDEGETSASLGRDDRRNEILRYVKKNGKITNRECRGRFGICRETARIDFKALVNQDMLISKGQGRGVHYVLTESQ